MSIIFTLYNWMKRGEGDNAEGKLTDAINSLNQYQKVYACEFEGTE